MQDVRKFLTDEEFNIFLEKIIVAYNEAPKLIPEFDVEKQAITKEQAEQLLPFILKFQFPYVYKMEQLFTDISHCLNKNEVFNYEHNTI